MEGWRLVRHSVPRQWSNEADVVDYIESIKESSMTIAMLDLVVGHCGAENYNYALIFLGDRTMKIMGKTPEDVCEEVQEFLDDAGNVDEASHNVVVKELTKASTLQEVASWFVEYLNVQAIVTPSTMSVLRALHSTFLKIANHYHNPCSPYRVEGNGFATWIEQKTHLGSLLSAKKPRFSEFLPIIHFLSRKPFLDCTSPAHMDQDLAIFDKKWEKWLLRYPIINHMLDPPLVAVELVAAGPQNLTLQQLVANILNQFQGPLLAGVPLSLPSGQVPRFLGDAAGGPPNSTFSSLIECATLEDANILGGILRSHYQNARGHGGLVGGAVVRIGVLATTARGVRVF